MSYFVVLVGSKEYVLCHKTRSRSLRCKYSLDSVLAIPLWRRCFPTEALSLACHRHCCCCLHSACSVAVTVTVVIVGIGNLVWLVLGIGVVSPC
jgi:hypothetical protein